MNAIKNNILILQFIFLTFLLVVEWTDLRNIIISFFSLIDFTDWEKILFLIPIVFSLQVTLLKDKSFYYFILFTYMLFFMLEFYLLIILLMGKVNNVNGFQAIDLNIIIKLLELFALASIVRLAKKIIKISNGEKNEN